MNERAVTLLRERVAKLNSGPLWVASSADLDPPGRIQHFSSVMEYYYHTVMETEQGAQAVLPAAEADELIRDCRFLDEVIETEPQLAIGPLDLHRQQWVGARPELGESGQQISGQQEREAPEILTPHPSRFIGPGQLPAGAPRVKPWKLGLYTSTVTSTGRGMWQSQLDSGLYSFPWHSWELIPEADVRVLEITTARDWVELFDRFPRCEQGILYPDWNKVSKDFDAVHLTMRAIIATQGFCFPAEEGITAAAYWDVESTLWLKWCFASVRLMTR